MTSAILILGIAAASAYVASAGAQAKPAGKPAFEITERRNEAAWFALTHALVIEKLLTTCAGVKDTLPQDPERILKSWNERNWERLEAAHGYLFYVRAAMAGKQGKEAGEAFYRRMTDEFEQQSANALSDVLAQQGPTAASCAKWTAMVVEGKADLNWKPQYIPVLDEILAFHRNVVGKPKP